MGLIGFTLTVACVHEKQGPPIVLLDDGVAVEMRLSPFSLVIRNGVGEAILATLTEGGDSPYGTPAASVDRPDYESQLITGWDSYRAVERPWHRSRVARLVERSDGRAVVLFEGDEFRLRLEVQVGPRRVDLTSQADSLVAAELPGLEGTRSGISFSLAEQERFFGLGERFGTVQHRGWSYYSWAEELGLGDGEDVPIAMDNPWPNGPSMTGFPVPWLISNRGYAVHLNTTYRTEFHLGSERTDAWRVAVNHAAFEMTVYVEESPLGLIDAFTRDTGRPLVPAPWVFGPRRRVSAWNEVDGRQEYELLRARQVPTTAIDDATHMLPHNAHVGVEESRRNWIDTLHGKGFKVMAYNNPYVSTVNERIAEEYAHGVEQGLFVLDQESAPAETLLISGSLQTIVTIDLTNPTGVQWFQDLLRRSLDLGYDGWMHDFGEYVERDWRFFDGRRGDELHNLFPLLSARAAFEVMSQERPDDFLFFVRSGYTGAQQYVPAVWGGDPEATFDNSQGLPAQLRGGLNLGMSGAPYWGSDISGFKCFTNAPRDKEVYLRWAQLGAVSPIMMDQNACATAGGQGEKWTLWSDEETTAVYGEMARLHTRLQPYFLTLAHEAHRTGAPLMRHPFLLYPDEPAAWEVEDAFFLGPSLFVAPVVRRGERTRSVWLPPGAYVDLDDYRVYHGGSEVEVPAPLVKLPLLLVDGQLVPMWDASIETLAPATDAEVVTLDDVKDRLDVIAALRPGVTAVMSLTDGTLLTASRNGPQGTHSQLQLVEAHEVFDCPSCYAIEEPGEVTRVRLTTPYTDSFSSHVQGVTVNHSGGSAFRVRWDLLLID
jgi:alpha-glucosidase (family GH31 glycosyl hydrolase)